MQEITLKIPNRKLNFFLELARQLGFEISQSVAIPEEHKVIVRARIKNGKLENMVTWENARKQLKFKN